MQIHPYTRTSTDLFYENFLFKRTSHTQIIYIIIILVIAILILSMSFIKVPLSVQGVGIIRPISEKTEVKSLVTEIVEQVFISEGQYIAKGAPILKLRTNNLDSRLQYLQYQQEEIAEYIRDLVILTNNIKNPSLNTLLYQKEFAYYNKQSDELQNRLIRSTIDFERNQKLYNQGVIAKKEFEDYTFHHNSAQNDVNINTTNQVSKWQNDLMKYKTTLKEIISNLDQINKEFDLYTLRAPVSGSVEHFKGIYPGSTISSSETIAILSPDSTLISEFYLSPKDIGNLSHQTEVRILVDAFYYNEWGCLKGKIVNISSDYVLIDNSPMFRVRCSLNRNFLSLQNGFKGVLKKGMTTQGRFKISERTLFQLLYQKTDNWLNPNQANHEIQSFN